MGMKRYGWLGALAILGLFTGCTCSLGGNAVKGSGVVKSESRPVAGFTAVSLGCLGKVTVKRTGREALTITAEENLLPLLVARVSARTLLLNATSGVELEPTRPLEFTVEVASLEGLSLTGAGSIEAAGIEGSRLAVTLSGAGSVTAGGAVDSLEVTLSGVGSFLGEGLKAKQATVRNSGVGSVAVAASDRLEAYVSGVGSIDYLGSPQLHQSVSGIGKVRKR